ncbi:MAG: methyltransferase domain-containing protein [Deinococcales bacterium]
MAEVHEVNIEKMIHGALALARLKDGRIALIEAALPGERVLASFDKRSGVLQGKIIELIEAHPERQPMADHPGLDYSMASYPLQLKLKHEVVLDSLTRQGYNLGLEMPALREAPKLWHYRHTVQPVTVAGGLGYREGSSHTPHPLPQDPSAHESINRLWQEHAPDLAAKGVKELAFRCNDAGEVLVCLIAQASVKNYLSLAHQLLNGLSAKGLTGLSYSPFDPRGRFFGKVDRLAGKRSILQRFNEFSMSVSTQHFAQPNPSAASMLYRDIESWLADLPKLENALDLYSGSGIIAFHLAKHIPKLIALDIDKGNIQRGEQDARRMGVHNVSFSHADARKLKSLPETDLISVDPPRTGLAKDVRQMILAAKARYLLYVSCDVATWSRDVCEFSKQGLELIRVQPYDFYPHTHHIEMLSLLARA